MPKQKTISVTSEDSRKRLDIFLSTKLGISRSRAQKMIEEKQIKVNGELPKKAGEQVKAGNKIVIASKTSPPAPLLKERGTRVPSPIGRGTEGEGYISPKIIAETPDYLVVEKPTGMLTHPTQAQEKNTLADWLVKKYPKIKKVGDDPVRPGIVHRLDKEASGLMVVAKNQKMFEHLKEQFKNRTVEKEYLALAHGKVAKDWDEINFPITRSETADRMAARPIAEEGKEAKTEFLVEKRFVNFTLLRIKIHTGRMHQIRVHLFAYNHPLAGDPLYIQKKRKRAWDEKLGRLFLYSTKLSFLDLAGERQTFESPLPKELVEFLKLLK